MDRHKTPSDLLDRQQKTPVFSWRNGVFQPVHISSSIIRDGTSTALLFQGNPYHHFRLKSSTSMETNDLSTSGRRAYGPRTGIWLSDICAFHSIFTVFFRLPRPSLCIWSDYNHYRRFTCDPSSIQSHQSRFLAFHPPRRLIHLAA